jgi:alpha-D-ribose 1-methylphosphonate 5-triphosphate synthase subunit PhnL
MLLDEPTASLDQDNRRRVLSLITEACAAGTAIIGIFHNAEERNSVATRAQELVAPPRGGDGRDPAAG